jgi:selenide,water dikinase
MRQRIVLVGGGHAHALVLARWAHRPAAAHVTVVSDRAQALYSGMVPGLVAGDYGTAQLSIDLAPLAARAGASFVPAAARALDTAGRRVVLAGGSTVPYDVLSLDVGSDVAGLDLPGVREHALATRPIADFVGGVGTLLERLRARAEREPATPVRLAVVGGGAAGVELALTFHARLHRDLGVAPSVSLVESGAALLGGRAPRLAARAARELARRGVMLRFGETVDAVDESGLRLRGGGAVPADAVVWSAGAAPLPWLRAASLSLDERGFVRVRSTLQSVSDDTIFVAGDAASLPGEGAPKAGVHAVRAAPVLAHNLEARLAGGGLRTHRPQRDFLVLLNAGDGTALGAKWNVAFEGPWVWRLKDWIDRRFLATLRRP